jgi:hypothetical protein
MKPTIGHTKFGSITVEGESFDHDIVIGLDGQVKKRKKKLSKDIYGTSHILSLPEAKAIFEAGAQHLIVGSGQSGVLRLSDEALAYFRSENCQVEIFPTPQAIQHWNKTKGARLGIFHVTC